MTLDDRRVLWLWAQRVLGAGTRLAQAAIEQFGDANELFSADEASLRMAGIFSPNKVKTILAHDVSGSIKTLNTARRMGFDLMTLEDEDYPGLLKNIHSPPLCLFVAGDRAHLNQPLPIAMVGTRDPNRYGLEIARLCANGLARSGAAVVSGLAIGIDATCHDAALKAGAPTVAVTGCGLDVDYPKPNAALRQRIEAGGCVVSEYPPGSPPIAAHFPVRNRIISGLSRGCVVVQCSLRSGSLVTAGLALGQNRDVFALCGPVNDPLMAGCHELVRQGAKPVFGILDILSEYHANSGEGSVAHMHAPPHERTAVVAEAALPDYLTDKQVAVLQIIRQSPQTAEAIAQLSELVMPRVLEILTELEIFGLAERHAGRVYRAR